MPVVLSGLVLVLLTVLCLAGEFLMELPQLDLKFFERVSIGLELRIALQVATPPAFLLHDDVFGGMHQGKYSWSF